MYNYYGYDMVNVGSNGSAIWTIVSAILAVVGGIALYFTVFSDSNKKKYKGFMAWLYDFVKFKKLFLSTALKILYLITAIYITLFSFGLISSSFLSFILCLIFGNIIARIAYEFFLVILNINENTSEINKKLK